MNIFNKVALQGLIKNRTRTIVTIIGVALSSAMITGIASFAVSLQNYMINNAVARYGGWHVEFPDVDASFVQERINDDEAQDTAAYENVGYAILDGGTNPDKPYLFIAGFSEEDFDTLPISLVSGRLPENSGEAVVPAHVASNGGVKISVGDTLSLAVGSRMDGNERLNQHDPYISGEEPGTEKETFVPAKEKTYTVVGICQRPVFEEYSAPGYTLITAADAAETADSFSVFVTLKNPYRVRSYAESRSEGSVVFHDDVLRFMGLSGSDTFNTYLYSAVGILVALIMIGSIFLVYNSFTISLNDRTQQFGILLSVGATDKQLRNSVLFEGICIGIVGIPLGVLMGIPSIRLVLSLVARNFGNMIYSTVPLTLTVSAPAIAAAAVISMITILISAYIPARKAARTPVMECIRQTNEIKVEPREMRISAFAERIYGLEGILALKNFKRNKRRYRSIVLSLTLSVVLFVSANAFGTSLEQETGEVDVDTGYDICFYTEDMEESELLQLYDLLKTAEGVYESSYQAIAAYTCPVRVKDFSDSYREHAGYAATGNAVELSMDIQFVEDRVYQQLMESLGLPAEEYTGPAAKLPAIARETTENGQLDMFPETSMEFTIMPKTGSEATQAQDITVTFLDELPIGVLPGQDSAENPYTFRIVAPYGQKEYLQPAGAPAKLGLTFRSVNPAQSTAEMKTMLEAAGVTAGYTLYNVYEAFEQSRNMMFIVNLFTSVFVIMISLISVANVFNTISTNIRLRRRELAMLRSIGMPDHEFNKMMSAECVFCGIRTLLFGIPLAGIVAWLIHRALVSRDVAFLFPWRSIGISVLGVFLVIFITMLYTVRRIKKENIIDALRADMT